MPKQLLPLIGGMVLVSLLVVAGLIAFIVPSDVLAPSPSERAAEQEAAQAELDEGAENVGEDTPGAEAAEDAPGGGEGDRNDEAADPGNEDTGDVREEIADDGGEETDGEATDGEG